MALQGCEAGAASSEEAASAPNPVSGTPEASGPTPPAGPESHGQPPLGATWPGN